MNDDQMDELLIQGARDYNAPNAVPREEMWARIAESRRAPAVATPPVHTRSITTWTWVRVAVAAAVVLAVGIGIGRRLERRPPAGAATTPIVAVQPVVVSPARDSAGAGAATKTDTIVPKLREETRNTDRRVRELAAGTPAAPRRDATDPSLAYQLVVLRHIAGSEAMITAFRASARRGEVDAQIASWARELLGTTRLLEASPVTQDPTMKRLLEDLDLVIVQIAQYVTRGTVNTEELDLIEESITKRGVITKLRSTLPVRNAPAGT